MIPHANRFAFRACRQESARGSFERRLAHG